MNERDLQLEEVGRLTGLLLTDALDEAGRRRLEESLLADPTAMEYYQDYVDVHSLLHWQHGHSEEQELHELGPQKAAESLVGAAAQQSNRVNYEIDLAVSASLPTTHHPLAANFVGGPVFSYMVATVVLCMMLLGAWAYKITRDAPIATNAPTPSQIEKDASRTVARITGMKDCQWPSDAAVPMVGSCVLLGRKYSLNAGLLEITYESGARVILEGPCAYTVDSSASGRLQLGRAVARVEKKVASGQWREAGAKPQAANSPPAPLFSVSTPTVVVTDLGTEFGVEVKAGGETQVHVFQGTVEAELYGSSGATGRKVKLTTGQAAGFDSRQASIVSVPSRPQEFTRVISMGAGLLRNVALKKTIIKWSGVYRYGDPTKGTSDWTTWDRFGVWHVNDGITDESEQGNAYWKGRERTPNEYFVIYLAGKYDIQRIELVNTHNSTGNDRGTKDFEIWAADEIDQYKELVSPHLVLKGTLPCRFGAGADIPCDVFSAEAGDFERFNACYVKFVAKTFYEGKNFGGCGLNEIRLFAVRATVANQPQKASPVVNLDQQSQ